MKLKLCALVVTILGLIWSCNTTHDITAVPQPGVAQDITIEEARSYVTRQQAGARLSGVAISKRNEYWNNAKKMAYKNGLPVVIVPLTYNYSPQLVINGKLPDNGKNFDKNDYAIQKKLFVYKDSKGNIQTDVVSFIPSEAARKKNKKIKGDEFDGYILAYDNSEQVFKGGWLYKNGKPQNRVKIPSMRNARTSAPFTHDFGPCDILVYGNGSGGQAAAQLTSGSSASGSGLTPSSGFTDENQVYWQLLYTIEMNCQESGNGPGAGEPPAWAPNDPSFGDVDWLWNTQAPAPSGGGGGGLAPPTTPYEPFMITENGVSGGSPEENFFYDMEYNNSPFIFFSNEEKALMIEFPGLMYSVKNYVHETGQKPDLAKFLLASNASIQQLENTTALLLEEGTPQPLNDRERNLLGFGTPAYEVNLKKFYSDARRASIMAIIFYGYDRAVSQGASRGNAFKHSLLAILHAVNFTRALGKEIAEAHEGDSQTVDSRMDRWNNEEGLKLYDQQPNVTLLVYSIMVSDAVFEGKMRYIANDGEQFLTPTNQ